MKGKLEILKKDPTPTQLGIISSHMNIIDILTNAEVIEQHTVKMLEGAVNSMRKLIRKAISSGAIDVDGWDKDVNSMILTKAILIAVMETEVKQYTVRGTSFEKGLNEDVKNLKYFL